MLIVNIENGTVNRLKEINAEFERMHRNYYTYEWTWAYEKLEEYYGVKPEEVTAADIIVLWRNGKRRLLALTAWSMKTPRRNFLWHP